MGLFISICLGVLEYMDFNDLQSSEICKSWQFAVILLSAITMMVKYVLFIHILSVQSYIDINMGNMADQVL